MLKKMAVAIFAVVVFQCALTMQTVAQSSNPCTKVVSCDAVSFGNTCVPNIPTGAGFNCVAAPTWGLQCQVMTNTCPPPNAEKRCPECEARAARNSAGSPIALGDGNTYIEETDVRIPGLAGGLALVRRWNSVWPPGESSVQIGLFGPNWRSTFEEKVYVGTDHFIKYVRGDGDFWSFGLDDNDQWSPAAPATIFGHLVPDPVHWTLNFQNGETRVFDYTTGHLLSITDRNGNTTQLTYDTSNRLVTVTDPASRHLYFGYPSGSSALVTSITSDFGISLSYAYDTQGRLIQVTKPDSTTISFTYNSQSLITAVTDSNGKILESHTYDTSGRGLTSSRAAGVEALTVAY